MDTGEQIKETLNRQRAAAVTFLRDTIGCMILKESAPHLCRAIADDIEMVYSAANKRSLVRINAYDLTHVLAEAQFRYKSDGDFPVCMLKFKPRMLPIGENLPVFREDEYLMRAGIVLQLQSDDTKVRIESGGREEIPPFIMEYTEERLFMALGEMCLSDIVMGFMVGFNLATGVVHGSFGMRF